MTSRTSKRTRPRPVITTIDEPRTRVFIVDDHELLCQALAGALEGAGFAACHLSPSNEGELLAEVDAVTPDVVLLDCDLGDPMGSSVPLVRPLASRGIPVVMLTGSPESLPAAEAVEAGAVGILGKAAPFTRVLDAIDRVVETGTLFDRDRRAELLVDLRLARAHRAEELAPFDQLTVREAEVLRLVCDGLTAAEIADASYVSVATVRSQIRSVLLKLGVSSQLAAVAKARKAGWAGA